LAGFNSASTSFLVNLLIGPPGLRVAATVFGWVLECLACQLARYPVLRWIPRAQARTRWFDGSH